MNQRIEELYKIIKDANEELKSIQKECSHDNTGEYNYIQGRPGNIVVAEMCEECRKYIRDTGKNWQPEYKMETFKPINNGKSKEDTNTDS